MKPSTRRPLDAAVALCALEDLNAMRSGPPLASLVEAWEAAWVACLSNDPALLAAAADAFDRVVAECHDDPEAHEWIVRLSGTVLQAPDQVKIEQRTAPT